MKSRHYKLITAITLLAVMLCVAAYAGKGKCRMSSPADTGESERKVTRAAVPAAALATLKKMAAGAQITEFAEEIEHGHTFYEGSWKAASGNNMDVLVTLAGDLVEIEEKVASSKVPATVRAMVNKKADEGATQAFEKKTMILYEVKFQKDERRYELLLTPDGRIIEKEVKQGGSNEDDEGDEDKDEDEDEDEQQVSIDDVPKTVKATIIKNSKGGKIEKIERENEDGKVIYEAEVTIDGREIELKIACCGKLLSKEIEDEDEKE